MPTPGEVAQVAPGVRRITQDNPSVFTGAGTNTHLVGERDLFILDPGPDNDTHFDTIVAAVGSASVAAVIPSHHHGDHWPMAPRLATHFGVQTLGFGPEGDYTPDRDVADGEELVAGNLTLRAIHTPGHAPDHLCYLMASGDILFSGDHVMGWSTSVIAPPGGSLNDFMTSLHKLRGFQFARMTPAHGLPIEEPYARIDEIHAHRLARTEETLAAMASGLETIADMVARIYADVDPRLHKPAGWSLLAHLQALVEDGRAAVSGDDTDPLSARWRLA